MFKGGSRPPFLLAGTNCYIYYSPRAWVISVSRRSFFKSKSTSDQGNLCCDGNCSHVYGYTVLLERLFPELARDMLGV